MYQFLLPWLILKIGHLSALDHFDQNRFITDRTDNTDRTDQLCAKTLVLWNSDGSNVTGYGLNRLSRFAEQIRPVLESFPYDESFGIELGLHEIGNILRGESFNILEWRLLSSQCAKELIRSSELGSKEVKLETLAAGATGTGPQFPSDCSEPPSADGAPPPASQTVAVASPPSSQTVSASSGIFAQCPTTPENPLVFVNNRFQIVL